MKRSIKKLARTLVVRAPFLQDTTYAIKRSLRTSLGKLAEDDLRALSFFPGLSGRLLLDVGANRGQTADALLRMTRDCCIQLFEPNPLLCSKLRAQYGEESRISVNEFGLGEIAGEYVLYVPFYGKWMFDGLAALDREKAGRSAVNRVFFGRAKDVTLREVKCRIRRLDDLSLAPFLVKLDVEGYELSALKGGVETIRAHEPVLLLEHPDEGVVDYLEGFGYSPYAFADGVLIPGRLGDLNTYFMTPEKSAIVKDRIHRPSRLTAKSSA